MIAPSLTRDEWRWLGLFALAAFVEAVTREAVSHALIELRRVQAEKREAARKAHEDSKAWRKHLGAP